MNAEVAFLSFRMKRLPPRHRLAHLRALIRREPARSSRRETLVALLRNQLAAVAANENRAR